MQMRKLMVAAMMLAAVSLSVNAAKKDKQEPAEPVLGIKSGVITMANNMGQFQADSAVAQVWVALAAARVWASVLRARADSADRVASVVTVR